MKDMGGHMLFSDKPDLSRATVEDCVIMYEKKGMSAVCNDGRVLCFVEEPLSDR